MKYEKMDKSLSKLVETVVEIGSALLIDSMVIDSDGVRGSGEGRFVAMNNIEWDYDIDGIAFGDILTLSKRIKKLDKPSIYLTKREKDNGLVYPHKIQMRKGSTKIEYVCTNPQMIKSPKQIKDDKIFTFTMNKEAVEMVSSSKQLMGSEDIIISGDANSVKLIANDVSSASMSHKIDTNITQLTDVPDFVFPYKTKNILGIFRFLISLEDEFEITISERGYIVLSLGDLNVYILREVI